MEKKIMEKELYVDIFTVSTLQDDGEICCPNCGSWTHVDDLKQDEVTGVASCPLCRQN
jgi:DNA-directed RNA polymerase subunit RPC12/RpoP